MKTRIYLSGVSNLSLSDIILAEYDPNVLVTFSEIFEGKRDSIRRVKRHYLKKVKGMDVVSEQDVNELE